MTATNVCSNFGGFRCRPPLLHEYLKTEYWNRDCTVLFSQGHLKRMFIYLTGNQPLAPQVAKVSQTFLMLV